MSECYIQKSQILKKRQRKKNKIYARYERDLQNVIEGKTVKLTLRTNLSFQ